MKSIKIKTNTKGRQMAYYWSNKAFRWMPLPLATAEVEIASGLAERVSENSCFGE